MHLILVQRVRTEVGMFGWRVKTQARLELIGGQDQRQSLVQGVLSIRGGRGLLAVDEIILGECVDQKRLASHRTWENIHTYRLVLEQESGEDSRKNGRRNSTKNLCHESCQRPPKALPPPQTHEKEW